MFKLGERVHHVTVREAFAVHTDEDVINADDNATFGKKLGCAGLDPGFVDDNAVKGFGVAQV